MSDAAPILVAGATGVSGHPLTHRLLARGHAVRVLAREPARARDLAEAGAEVVAGDVLDAAATRSAAAGCGAVVHLATAIPDGARAGDPGAWDRNDRIRRAGTSNLLAGAERGGAGLFVLQSVVMLYADGGDDWIDAADPEIAPSPRLRSALDAEDATFGSGVRFLVLRQGLLFGAGTGFAASLLDGARAGSLPIVAERPIWIPLLHPADFARIATVALEHDLHGVYDAVSDVAPAAELIAAAASATGSPPPARLGEAGAREQLGSAASNWLTSRRVSDAALREIGVAPGRGWRAMLREAVESRMS